MNKRLRKKAEKNRRRDIHRILDMVLDINGLEARKREITGSKPTVFLSFSGHVAKIEVSIHECGWFPYCKEDRVFRAYIDNPDSLKRAVKEMARYCREVI